MIRLGSLFETGDAPREAFNWRLGISILAFGILGAARGLDEGAVSGMESSPTFKAQFLNYDSASKAAEVEGNISSMVQLLSIGGALFAFLVVDWVGRVWALRELCTLWIIGSVVEITSTELGQLYAGRCIKGLAIGQTAVVGPTYLAEIAPAEIRGMVLCAFSGTVYLGIMVSYFANWGCSIHMEGRQRWVTPLTVQIIFAGLTLIASLPCVESPRMQLKRSGREKAVKALERLRGLPITHPYVSSEFEYIEMTHNEALDASHVRNFFGKLYDLGADKGNRYRLMVGVCIQLLGQWSGANALTIYAPTFFGLLGISGDQESLFATAIFGVVKFVSSLLCAFFLIDRIGRTKSVYIGIGLQMISMLYVAILLGVKPDVASDSNEPSTVRASTAGIVAIYINGFGWAMGYNAIQYSIVAEIFPLYLRALATSIIMCLHFANQYGNSKALPNMILSTSEHGITPMGTMIFFTVVCAMGLAWVYLCLVETSGIPLEKLSELFVLPWYKVAPASRKLSRFYRRELGGINDRENTMADAEDDYKEAPEHLEYSQRKE